MKLEDQNSAKNILKRRNRNSFELLVEGLIVGAAAAGIAVVYRLLLDMGEHMRIDLLQVIKEHVWMIAVWFIALFLLSLMVGKLVEKDRMIAGSGIPQVEGEMQSSLSSSWLRVLLAKMTGGILCGFAGLSLGREGPSIQLGAMCGKGISRGLKKSKTEEKYMLTCGASAGLAAAFNAPLAGIMFALEELHKNFSASILVCVMAASTAADFISKNIFGLSPVFHFEVAGSIPLSHYGILIVMGILLGLFGAFYNWMTLKTQDMYELLPGKIRAYKLAVPFLCAGVLGLMMPSVLGGGHLMIEKISEGNMMLGMMLLLLTVKLLFSMISFGSGAPGGIFFPLLVIGAYFGGAYGSIVIRLFDLEPDLISNFIILAMAGYFTAIVRAPITGIVLICEMTGTFHHLLSLSVIAIIAYMVTTLLNSMPIYESLLERILWKQGVKNVQDHGVKLLLEQAVELNSAVVSKKVCDIEWPGNCLLVSIVRGEEEIIPKGDTVIQAFDHIVMLAGEDQSFQLKQKLNRLCASSV